MALPVFKGTADAILQPLKVSSDPVRGLTVEAEWIGVGSAGIIEVAAELVSQNIAFSYVAGINKSTLKAIYTEGGLGVSGSENDHHQLIANEIQVDLKLAPSATGLSFDKRSKALAAADDFINNPTIPTWADSGNPAYDATMAGFFECLIAGFSHFQFGQYVLKWSTTVGFNSSGFRAGNEELLYSTSQVISESNPPFAIANAMSAITPQPFTGNFYWSWRRLPSTRTTQANNRIEIATEYYLGAWPTFVYSIA